MLLCTVGGSPCSRRSPRPQLAPAATAHFQPFGRSATAIATAIATDIAAITTAGAGIAAIATAATGLLAACGSRSEEDGAHGGDEGGSPR